ncbi:hypothetical protein B0H13DRAFT_2342924 [Mycena leptocephala]|nr:hypothetical protein B0H13DRAFT_2342924 [Mycena leptocephala]
MPCNGRGNGCSKKCPVFKARKPGDDDGNAKCKRCSHRKRAHTESTLGDILTQYNLGGLKKPPTDSEARKETSAGFRPGGSGSNKTGKSTRKSDSATPRMIKIAAVHVIIHGLNGEGDLRITQCPTAGKVEDLLKKKFAVLKTPDKKDLEFNPNWTQKRIDKWLRELLPLLFKFLDLRYPGVVYHWVLLGKDQRSLFVMDRETTTGAELDEAKGPSGRKFQDHVYNKAKSNHSETLDVATKHKIPSSVRKSLPSAIEAINAGEEVPSESEEEEIITRRKSQAPKVKPAVIEVESESSSEASDCEAHKLDGDLDVEVESDKAHRPPTWSTKSSQSAVAVKEEEDGDKYDSDIEEVFPPSHEAFLGEGYSRKRSASFFDDARDSKRVRSRSQSSHRSGTSSTVSYDDDASTSLRPVTSSFQYDPALGCASSMHPPMVVGATPVVSYSTWTPTWAPSDASTTLTHSVTGTFTSGQPSVASTSASTSAKPASSSSSTSIPAAATSSAILQATHRISSRPSLQRYVAPPAREGLTVPKTTSSPWN